MIERPQTASIDRLSAFFRRFELRVDFVAASFEQRPTQLAVVADGDGPVALFAAGDVRDVAAGRNVLLTAGISFGGAQNPLLIALDQTIELRPRQYDPQSMILQALLEEWRSCHCGSAVTVERLCEALVVQLLRKAVADGRSKPGLLLGLSHPSLHRTLVAIHEQPRNNWRIADLAELAAMSRSAFMASFTASLGCPPTTYLTRWRLSEAKRHLEKGLTVKQAAREVGFGSAEALSRAYKRLFGVPPNNVRRMMCPSAGSSTAPPHHF